ncbi:MAG: Protein phosphatase methylesterase 1 [Bathelium mastoideum]|nr:MAG: Protein phosphatase methylesterase 1 [Bathelium mastoideum]KAI9687271.1 MAG: Protein phosphatase methylesterase 1 [Bathelium mastoideum]
MSDLARSFAAQKLADLPKTPPQHYTRPSATNGEDREDDYSSESSLSSTGTVLPSPRQHLVAAPPVQWSSYFAQELFLPFTFPSGDEAKYHVYLTPPANSKAPLFVCHHGAGASGMSFALFTRALRASLPDAGVLSVEARQHGSSILDPSGAPVTDFAIAALSDDLANVMTLIQQKLNWATLPLTVLIGHSLGGAVVVDVARRGVLGTSLVGYVVIDVVEGSAIEALSHMQRILASRPASFPSIDAAIDWHLRTRVLRRRDAAQASVPSLLRPSSSTDNSGGGGNGTITTTTWTWATDLALTQPFWSEWFTGMSGHFLGARGAKLLILAGTDRLDRELMIGQMQGRFQLVVVPESGHFVQEDAPERTAEVVAEFWRRNDRGALVLPPKVGELLAQGKKV